MLIIAKTRQTAVLAAISGFCGLGGGKQFNISESKFLCCKSKITISALHKLKGL